MNSIPGSPRDIKPRRRSGFAVIMSVIVVNGVALVASLSAAALYLNQSHEMTKWSYAVQARSSAYSCANVAMLRLKQNSSYTGNENISVDKVICLIEPVAVDGAARTVHAQATVNGLTSRIKVEIADIEEFFLSTWTEVSPQ